jgi:hypothetical protein
MCGINVLNTYWCFQHLSLIMFFKLFYYIMLLNKIVYSSAKSITFPAPPSIQFVRPFWDFRWFKSLLLLIVSRCMWIGSRAVEWGTDNSPSFFLSFRESDQPFFALLGPLRSFYYTQCFKKSFTTLNTSTELFRRQIQCFELSLCSKIHQVLQGQLSLLNDG